MSLLSLSFVRRTYAVKPYNNNNCTQPKKQLKLSEVGKTVKNLSQTEFEKRSLMRNVTSLSNDTIQQLKTELEKIKHYCRLLESYMGFTIHWMNPITLERNSRVLACGRMLGRHAYDNIAEIIEKVLTEIDIQSKTTLIVADNADNFVKAFKVFGVNNEIDNSGYNTEMRGIEIEENDEILRTVNITEILDGQIGQNINDILDIKLLIHQRRAAHILNLIVTVDILSSKRWFIQST
ncbi:Ribonuclease H-like domain [Cinara cedri]|uniref:Ribonuclease H-like domain n=1 Tax=Cinara cedri TaxID=506608 RepID=A0A5E4MA65_9HEMI|nr:Ribonuclease H-like domain [Cinara cedri]